MHSITNLRTIVNTLRVQAAVLFIVTAGSLAVPVAAQQTISVARFRSVELRNGGSVILRSGQTQQVNLLTGNTDCVQINSDGGVLVIDKNRGACRGKQQLEIEIVTPKVEEVSVANGGMLQSRGSFPRQAEIKATVTQGGRIDIRSITADRVTASVEQGGRILVTPQVVLSASVANGGQITYWGEPQIQKSIDHGGAISKGGADEADESISKAATCTGKPQTPSAPASGRPRSWIF